MPCAFMRDSFPPGKSRGRGLFAQPLGDEGIALVEVLQALAVGGQVRLDQMLEQAFLAAQAMLAGQHEVFAAVGFGLAPGAQGGDLMRFQAEGRLQRRRLVGLVMTGQRPRPAVAVQPVPAGNRGMQVTALPGSSMSLTAMNRPGS